MDLTSGTRLGPYEVLAPLGAGGMGEVYRARDTRLGREVAVKVLPAEFASDPERLRRFEQEARATAALEHPNILAIYDIGTHEGTPYIVEQLLEGESLRQRLRGGALTPVKAVEFGIQIAEGLAAAHEKGIVHRDLKPENLFVTKDGRVKILDFGLARLRQQEPLEPEGQSEAATADSPTREGRVLGTPGYMSPEQLRGRAVDARTDIFAFGVVLYEMLAGHRAFEGLTQTDVVAALLKEDPSPLPKTIPPGLHRVVRQCLEKRPDDRISSAHDLVLALQAVSGENEAEPRPAPTPVGWAAWLSTRRLLVGSLAGLLVVVALGLLAWKPWKRAMPRAEVASRGVPSLVALPCKVLGSPESAYLTDAIPSTISTILGEVEGLDTKVPPTSFEVEKVHGDMDKIADAYGVQAFVLSTATAEGDHLVFNIQVADARTRKIHWSHEYQGSRENYLAMAHEAAQGICRALLPGDSSTVPIARRAISSEAELAYQEGRFHNGRLAAQGERSDFNRAMASFQRALALDPKMARAAAGIAGTYGTGWTRGMVPRDEAQSQEEAWIGKALALDPKCSRAWNLRANLESMRPDPSMERWLDYALKASYYGPYATSDLDLAVSTGGALSLGIECCRENLRRDPLHATSLGLEIYLTQMGKAKEALPLYTRQQELLPGNDWAPTIEAYSLAELGRTREAEALLKEMEPKVANKGLLGVWFQTSGFAVALAGGDEQSSKVTAREVNRLMASPKWTWSDLQSWESALLPLVARKAGKEDALELFQLCSRRGAYIGYDMLMLRPDLKELREDPRAAEGVRQTKAWFARTIKILQDARARGELPEYLEKPMDDLLRELSSKGAWP